jgi:hypothetical protein
MYLETEKWEEGNDLFLEKNIEFEMDILMDPFIICQSMMDFLDGVAILVWYRFMLLLDLVNQLYYQRELRSLGWHRIVLSLD